MMCQHVIGFLMDYLNRELPAEQQTAFELHLAQCPSCINYLNSYRQTVELGRALSEEDGDPAMPEELVLAVLESSRGLV
jgi:anti-sigma factor RsiW